MKIQCACGAKYEFDVTPEMWQNPVKLVCTECGLDSSEYVNQLVREEIAENFPEVVAQSKVEAPRLKISRTETPAEAPAVAAPVSKFCQKHRGVPVTEKCFVCGKPICPKCMEDFGYFCSPFCQNKAELQGIDAPVYAGQKFQVHKKYSQKVSLAIGGLAALVILFLSAWTWYAWFGAVPHNYFAVRFADNDRGYFGRTELVGKDQLVFLHGSTLARYDLKTQKSVWTQELFTKEDIAAAVKEEQRLEAEINANSDSGFHHSRSADQIERDVKIALQSALRLRVSGENIWVGKGNLLTHYDWATGRSVREISLPEFGGELIEKDGELLMLGDQSVTHVSLASGDSRVETFQSPGATNVAFAAGAGQAPGGGLFAKEGQALDPNKVNAQVQNLTLPARIALPALLSSARHEQQLEAAMQEGNDAKRPRATTKTAAVPVEIFDLVAGEDSYAQFSKKLLEEKIVTRSAMREPPKTSALNGNVNVTQTAEVANEILNEMQRNAGGDTVEEDQSRYQVAVRLPDSPETPAWTGEVTGPPQLFVLKTVNVITAGKTVIVLDKSNKKVWEASLTYPVGAGRHEFFSREKPQFGEGPCVEYGNTLYVYDQALLTSFDLASGNARWRVPSVGVAGLFFDDADNIYLNTTSGNPDDIKYSRQIDVNKHTDDIVTKLDPKTGKTLWSIKPDGFISYLKGKFIYAVQSYDPNPTDEENISEAEMSLQKPAFLRIVRINPKNGRTLWEYYDRARCPVDVRFHENSIELVFKREVQVLRYLAF